MSVGMITALEIQKRNKERVNVYLDGEFAFALSLIEAAHLRKGQQLSKTQIDSLRQEDAVIKAVDKAARFLSYRPRSTHEVRRNLAQSQIPEAVIDAAVTRLTAQGYLNDDSFARFWVENRRAFKLLGAKALRYELRQKGVADEVINSILEENGDEDLAAYEAASKQARRLRSSDPRTFRQKLSVFLQRRGFSYSSITYACSRLADELNAEDPGFFASPSREDDFAEPD